MHLVYRWVVIARAFVVLMLLCGVAFAWPPPAPRPVPILLVDPPPTFDRVRFDSSLQTYVTNAQLLPTPHAAATDDMICNDAFSAARDARSPVAMWARWTDAGMTVFMVSVDKDCGVVESSTVDVPPDQPDFVYRVAALKIASLLRSLPEETGGHLDEPEAPARTSLAWRDLPLRVPPTYYGAVDLGVTGVASTEAAARTYALVASAWIKSRFYPTYRGQGPTRLSYGLGLLASAAHDADAAGGSGRARVFGAFGGLRIRAWGNERDGRLAVIGELDAGVLSVWASADRVTGADAMSETVWAPFVAVAPHLRIKIAGPLHVTVGPTLDLALRRVELSVGESALYRASLVRFRWDARAQLWF